MKTKIKQTISVKIGDEQLTIIAGATPCVKIENAASDFLVVTFDDNQDLYNYLQTALQMVYRTLH